MGAVLREHTMVLLNLAICVLALLANFFFSILRDFKSREVDLDLAQKAAQADGASEGARVIQFAFECWTLSWVAWVLLYLVKLSSAFWGSWSPVLEVSMLWLSDLNSVLLLLSYWCVSRGKSASITSCYKAVFIAITALTLFDFILLAIGAFLTGSVHRTVFLQYLSVTLSIAAPILLGRAVRLRFNTNSVWILAVGYAALQPFAYGFAFGIPGNYSVVVPTSQPIKIPGSLRPLVEVVDASGAPIAPTTQPTTKPASQPASSQAVITDEAYFYRVFLRRNDCRMDGEKTSELLKRLESCSSNSSIFWLEVRLRFEDIIFALLASLKLFWSATVLAAFRDRPVNYGPTVMLYDRPSKDHQLVPSLRLFYWGQISSGILVVAIVSWYVGLVAVTPIVLYLAVWSLPMYVGKGGKTWSDFVEQIVGFFKGK